MSIPTYIREALKAVSAGAVNSPLYKIGMKWIDDNPAVAKEIMSQDTVGKLMGGTIEPRVAGGGLLEKPKFDKNFLIPEKARAIAQKWVNAGGSPTQMNSVLDYLDDIALTKKQRDALIGSLPDESKSGIDYILKENERTLQRYIDKGMTRKEALEKQANSKLYQQREKSLDREIIASALKEEYFSKAPLGYGYKYDPATVFGSNPKQGAVSKINDTLDSLKTRNADRRAAEEATKKTADSKTRRDEIGLKLVGKESGTAQPGLLGGIAAGAAAGTQGSGLLDAAMQGLDFVGSALEIPARGLHGLAAGAGSLMEGKGVPASINRAGSVARQPLGKTAEELGKYTADKTGNPYLASIVDALSRVGSL